MKIRFKNSSAEEIHGTLSKLLKSDPKKNGFEYQTHFRKKMGDLTLKTYVFEQRFNVHIMQGDNYSPLEFVFSENNNNNQLRFFFIKKGQLIHTVSPSIRYRLSDSNSCIVAVMGKESHTFTFPVQNNIEIIFLELDTKSFSIDLQADFFQLPGEIGNVLKNEKMESHFIYHSNYTLIISDTINELIRTQKEGIVKRFFLESKALELLWLQTEQYRQETRNGYNSKVLRKQDVSVIKKAKDYIRTYLDKPLTLIKVARAVGTNETKLKTGFKRLFGKNFSEILRSERMNKAKVLLEDGQLSIKEVSYSCGYKSPSMFSTRFKKQFGVSPNQYFPS